MIAYDTDKTLGLIFELIDAELHECKYTLGNNTLRDALKEILDTDPDSILAVIQEAVSNYFDEDAEAQTDDD